MEVEETGATASGRRRVSTSRSSSARRAGEIAYREARKASDIQLPVRDKGWVLSMLTLVSSRATTCSTAALTSSKTTTDFPTRNGTSCEIISIAVCRSVECGGSDEKELRENVRRV